MNRIWPLLLIAASALAQPKPPIAKQLTFTPYHATGIYKTGETVGWIVKTVQAAPSYSYKWTARYALNAKSVAARAAEGWLVMDVDSHDKLPFEPTGNAPKNYAMVGDTDRETSYFLNMYLRDSRALDYLMGGQQSLMLAGLRPEKITAVLVCYRHRFPARGHLYSTESNSCSKATGQTGGLVKTEMNGREGSLTRGSRAGEGACPTKPCVFSGTGESSLGGGFANDRIGA